VKNGSSCFTLWTKRAQNVPKGLLIFLFLCNWRACSSFLCCMGWFLLCKEWVEKLLKKIGACPWLKKKPFGPWAFYKNQTFQFFPNLFQWVWLYKWPKISPMSQAIMWLESQKYIVVKVPFYLNEEFHFQISWKHKKLWKLYENMRAMLMVKI
jgi:hypothetical protein